MVVFGQIVFIWAKVVVFRQEVVFAQIGCIWVNCFFILGKSGSIWANVVVYRQKLLFLLKVVAFGGNWFE